MTHPLMNKLYYIANSKHEMSALIASKLALYNDYLEANMPTAAGEHLAEAVAAMLYYEMEHLIQGLENQELLSFTIHHN